MVHNERWRDLLPHGGPAAALSQHAGGDADHVELRDRDVGRIAFGAQNGALFVPGGDGGGELLRARKDVGDGAGLAFLPGLAGGAAGLGELLGGILVAEGEEREPGEGEGESLRAVAGLKMEDLGGGLHGLWRFFRCPLRCGWLALRFYAHSG